MLLEERKQPCSDSLLPSSFQHPSLWLTQPNLFPPSLSFPVSADLFQHKWNLTVTEIKREGWGDGYQRLEPKPGRRCPQTEGHQICQGPFPQVCPQGRGTSAVPIVSWSKANQKVREAPMWCSAGSQIERKWAVLLNKVQARHLSRGCQGERDSGRKQRVYFMLYPNKPWSVHVETLLRSLAPGDSGLSWIKICYVVI